MASDIDIVVQSAATPGIDIEATVVVAGPPGAPGEPGEGLPLGGTTGQILTKNSSTDLDYAWQTPAGAGDMLKATYDPTNKAGDAFSMANMTETTSAKVMTSAERTKLSGIETAADVTDAANVAAAGAFMKSSDTLDNLTAGTTNVHFTATDKTKLDGVESSADRTDADNVAAAGAVMESDTTTASMAFVVDEDDMLSNSNTKVPTQQSVKAYVDANLGGGSTGDVTGPSGSAASELAIFADATGKTLGRATDLLYSTTGVGGFYKGSGIKLEAATTSEAILKSGTAQISVKQDNGPNEVQVTGGMKARLNPRATAISSTSVTPDLSTTDFYHYASMTGNLTINAPTGTPQNGNKLLFAFKDNGTSRTLTWNAIFTGIGVSLPASTTAGKWIYVGAVYNSSVSKWHVIAVSEEA